MFQSSKIRKGLAQVHRQEVFLISVPFIKRGGWKAGLGFREIIIESIERGLKVTSQAAALSEIVCRSVLRSKAD